MKREGLGMLHSQAEPGNESRLDGKLYTEN